MEYMPYIGLQQIFESQIYLRGKCALHQTQLGRSVKSSKFLVTFMSEKKAYAVHEINNAHQPNLYKNKIREFH